jgi:hypothetical protein
MERRIDLTKVFTLAIIVILISTAILSYNFATKLNFHKQECDRLGGVLVHGAGIGLCVKIEESTNE